MDFKTFLRESMKRNEEEAKELMLQERQKKINEINKNSGFQNDLREKHLRIMKEEIILSLIRRQRSLQRIFQI